MRDPHLLIRATGAIALGIAALVYWLRIPRHGDRAIARDPIESGGFGFARIRGRNVRVSNAGESDIHPGDRCRVVLAAGRFVMVVADPARVPHDVSAQG